MTIRVGADAFAGARRGAVVGCATAWVVLLAVGWAVGVASVVVGTMSWAVGALVGATVACGSVGLLVGSWLAVVVGAVAAGEFPPHALNTAAARISTQANRRIVSLPKSVCSTIIYSVDYCTLHSCLMLQKLG